MPKIFPHDLKPLLSHGAPLMAKTFFPEDNPAEITKIFRDKYSAYSTSENSIYDGAREFLQSLLKLEINLAVCSNKPFNLCNKVLEDVKLNNFFSLVIGGDTLPEKKPSSYVLKNILDFFQASAKETIFFGDSEIDKLFADSLGVLYAHHESGYENLKNDKDNLIFSYAEISKSLCSSL